MSFEDIMRHFADASQLDQAIPLANKLTEIIRENSKPL